MENYFLKNKIFISFLFGLLLISFISCSKTEDKVPYVPVNIQINLSNPEYINLNAIGNSIYVTGGYKGIILYRQSIDEIIAMDRACPYDPDCSRVILDDTGIIATDTCCGSEYSVIMTGAVLKGPSEYPLRQYQCYFNQNTNELQITN